MSTSELPLPIGQRIKVVRKKRGLTLVQLSEQIGISNQALSDIERGKKNPSKQTLMSLARELESGFGITWLQEQVAQRREEGSKHLDAIFRRGEKRRVKEAFEHFLDFYYGPKANIIYRSDLERGAVTVPLLGVIDTEGHYQADGGNDLVTVPAGMARAHITMRALRVLGESLYDALVGPSDIVIVADDYDLEDGKLALVEVNGYVLLRRLSVGSNHVILHAVSKGYEPVRVPLNKIKCLGVITGVIRFTG